MNSTTRPKRLRVAIDGPAGAGKSTVASRIAREMGYLYLNTGAMYRAMAIAALDRGISLDDPIALGNMAKSVDLQVREDNGLFRAWVDGVEVTDRLKDPGTDRAVKVLAMMRPVREVLVNAQRQIAKEGAVVMEGRDIASVVMPDAEVKVFLTADLCERARRRWRELREKGIDLQWEEVLEEMEQRDQKDLEREWGRLVQVEDAHLVDSTHKTIDEVCAEIVALCEAMSACCTGS
jgi:cytidylate kinase